MTEVLLDEAQVDTGFEEVGGIAVTKRVDRDSLLDPEIRDDAAKGTLDRGFGERSRRRASSFPPASEGGKEESRILVRYPVTPEDFERALGKRHVAIDRALATVNVNAGARGVEVAHLERATFGEPESERVDGPEASAALLALGGGDDAANLLEGEDIGELALRWDAQAL